MTEALLPGALAGVRVLEIAQALAVPFAGVLLGDMGADVVKVEPPSGDGIRYTMEPILPGESKGFTLVNRSKRSICLDVTRPEARPVIEALVRWADVVMAEWDIKVINASTTAALPGITINDAGAHLESVANGSCTGTDDTFVCSANINSTLTLVVSRPLSAASNANNTCLPGTINNTITSATLPGTNPVPLTVHNPAAAIDVPGTAAASCVTIKKTGVANSIDSSANNYTITLTNTGPATTAIVKDAISGATLTGPLVTTPTPDPPACTKADLTGPAGCTVNIAANGTSTLTVSSTPVTNNTCESIDVVNTATATWATSGTALLVTAGKSNRASRTYPAGGAECNNGQQVTFTKFVCPTVGDIPPAPAAGDSQTRDQGSGDCVPAAGWRFKLGSTSSNTGDLGTTAGTDASGNETITLSTAQLDQAHYPYLFDGAYNGLWVSEVEQTGFTRGRLGCYLDHSGTDNLELINLPSDVTSGVRCIAYNVSNTPPTGTVTVRKIVSGNQLSSTDQFHGNVTGQTAHSYTDLSGGHDVVYTGQAFGSYSTTEDTSVGNMHGYTITGYSASTDGTCAGPTSTRAADGTNPSPVSVTLNADHLSVTLCVYNTKFSDPQTCGPLTYLSGAADSRYQWNPNTYADWTIDGVLVPTAGNAVDHKWIQVMGASYLIYDNGVGDGRKRLQALPEHRPRTVPARVRRGRAVRLE